MTGEELRQKLLKIDASRGIHSKVTRKTRFEYLLRAFRLANKNIESLDVACTSVLISYIYEYFDTFSYPKDFEKFDYELLESKIKNEYEKLIASEIWREQKQIYIESFQSENEQKLLELETRFIRLAKTRKGRSDRYHKRTRNEINEILNELFYLIKCGNMKLDIKTIHFIRNILLFLKDHSFYICNPSFIDQIEEDENVKQLIKEYDQKMGKRTM